MNRIQVLEYIRQPIKLQADSASDLRELCHRYPYFQGAYVLLARALHLGNDMGFDQALKEAAVHSPDRSRLFEMIHTPAIAWVEEVRQEDDILTPKPQIEERIMVPVAPLPEPEVREVLFVDQLAVERPLVEHGLQDIEEADIKTSHSEPVLSEQEIFTQILTYPEIISSEEASKVAVSTQEAGEERHTFFEWLQLVSQPGKNAEHVEVDARPARRSKTELIEQFILTEPKISRPEKATFFSPVSMAKRSVEDRQEIVSETLAQVFESQGNIEKAIQIYQKLCLQEPAKISYFAALIEKLENQA